VRKLFRGLFLAGALAGGAVAVRNYLQRTQAPGEEAVQLTFDDGSTYTLDSRSVKAQEFTDIADKLLEIGL
jgi:hypothetical protein